MPDSTSPDLIRHLEAGLSAEAAAALSACVRICTGQHAQIYLVGGAVRDLLLGREHVDLDLAVESDTQVIARALADATGGRAVVHPRFGTASVSGQGYSLDLARTRSETYARPGALPTVEFASIADDLARRDFSINAIALRLSEPAGTLFDPFGGADDISHRLVRVLHDRSFQDDATRILRTVRYAARLGFAIESDTETWLKRDLSYLESISGARLRRELTLLCEEPTAVEAALMAQSLGVLPAIHSSLRLDDAVAGRWRQAVAGRHHAVPDELGICVLAAPRDQETVRSLSQRLHLTGRFERALRDFVRLRAASDKLTADTFEAAELLDTAAPAAVWALAVVDDGKMAATCLAYLTSWRRLRPHLTGKDLLAMGVAAGAAIGDALRQLRRARIEGRATTREDEIDIVRRLVAGRQ